MNKNLPFAICVLQFAIFILSPLSADAAYKIYLKNGSVITGVGSYEKSGGEIRFYFEGGIVGIPERDVLKIEGDEVPARDIRTKEELLRERNGPPEKKEITPSQDTMKKISDLKTRLNVTNKRLAEISKKESELEKIEEDLRRTRLRIQVLYDKSVNSTITSAERQMLQQNMLKKRKLKDDKAKLEEELKPLLDEKERLLEDKRLNEQELKELEEGTRR